MKKFIQNLLKRLSIKIIRRHKPLIIAVTGSVGKTSTRNAIAALLGAQFHLRTNTKNYNNEFGVPLTIIGESSPGRSFFGWLQVLIKAGKLAWFTDSTYPRVLVLEYGADHPGDISYLCSIAQPDIAVLTAISPVHLEHFGTMELLMKEKGTLLECVKKEGCSIINLDDVQVRALADRSSAPVITYGFSPEADVHVDNHELQTREDFSFEPGEVFCTQSFEVNTHEGQEFVELKNRLGSGSVLSVLAGCAVGLHLGMTLTDLKMRVDQIQAEPGRMNPIPGIKGSFLLDDSYNAAPASVVSALDVLKSFSVGEGTRRIAVLGSMAELGPLTEQEHRMIGLRVAEGGIDLLVCVGEPTIALKNGALEAGMPESSIEFFEDSRKAGRWLDQQVHKGDVVLVKGSQSTRMEFVMKDLMAEPLQAKELLVRQEGKWLEE
ncbi:hypothetical protein A2332_04700 [Candidatus Uhrbacteria bacterium RIFOXYB2_FULL_41_18]|nr:MAG: hypothetical protein A2332_04700 [Candidatus Uhrbacteria bacterium RIFOXYB2_FULL_41_18]